MNKRVKNYRMLLWGMSLAGVLVFIFSNSLTPAHQSSQESGEVYGALAWLFDFLPFLSHHFVRKAAHFCEYALLGAIVAFMPCFADRHKKASYAVSLLLGAAVGLTDEGIQYFVPGRASSFGDAVLDYAGYIAGFLLLGALLLLWHRKREKRRGQNEKR